MSYDTSWNGAFELSPANSDDLKEGAGKIRALKVAIRQRMEKDHYMDTSGTDADHGEHKKVTLREQAADPSAAANKGFLYTKDVSSKTELFYRDSAGNTTQITSVGRFGEDGFPADTMMVFYQDAAPDGWEIQDTLDDKLLFITKGSVAGGETGGGAHSSGTWTQPNHTHTISEHTHDVIVPHDGWADVGSGEPNELAINSANHSEDRTLTSEIGGDSATGESATADTWRPAAYCAIIAKRL